MTELLVSVFTVLCALTLAVVVSTAIKITLNLSVNGRPYSINLTALFMAIIVVSVARIMFG